MALTADLVTFRLAYPEFQTVSDAAVQFRLDDAIEQLNEAAWGLCYAKAVLSYAAHELALSQARIAAASVDEDNGAVSIAPTGQITQASAEGLSVSFAGPSQGEGADSAYFAQTPYGQNYLALRRQCLSRGELSW